MRVTSTRVPGAAFAIGPRRLVSSGRSAVRAYSTPSAARSRRSHERVRPAPRIGRGDVTDQDGRGDARPSTRPAGGRHVLTPCWRARTPSSRGARRVGRCQRVVGGSRSPGRCRRRTASTTRAALARVRLGPLVRGLGRSADARAVSPAARGRTTIAASVASGRRMRGPVRPLTRARWTPDAPPEMSVDTHTGAPGGRATLDDTTKEEL